MRVGLDLDGVVFNFVGGTARLFKTVPANPDRQDIESYLKTKLEKDALEQLLHDPKFMCSLEVFPGVEDKLFPYLNQNHDVYIVSGRKSPTHAATERRLAELGLRAKGYRWSLGGGKSELVKDLDTHIDDLPSFVQGISKDFPVIMPTRSYNITYINKVKNNRMLFWYQDIPQLIDTLEMLDGGLKRGSKEGR